MALLPAEAAPDDYGYRPADLRWAGGDLRLYGRAPGVRYHRAFGKGGKSLVVAPGQPLTLRLGARRIALLGERDPEADAAEAAREYGVTLTAWDALPPGIPTDERRSFMRV